MSMLVYCGVEEREERIAKLAGTTEKEGTTTEGILFTFGYFGMEVSAGEGMTTADIREAIDQGHPVLLTLQAYRGADVITTYSELWDQGHYVVAIGYEGDGTAPDDKIIFEDPADFHRTFLSDGELNERWHDDNGAANPPKLEHWGCILMTPSTYQHDFMSRME
jgi:hypothetical protein